MSFVKTGSVLHFTPLHWRSWLWIYESAAGGHCVWVLGHAFLYKRTPMWWARGR